MSFDVITIGSAVLDVLLKSKAFLITPVHDEPMLCERSGGKMDVEEALVTSGGAASNTAVSFARQKFKTACVAKLGVDLSAQVVIDDLARERVVTDFLVERESVSSGISGVLVASDGSRSAMTYRGAAHDLQVSDVDFGKLGTPRAVHLSSVGNLDLIKHVSRFCMANNVFLSWNPSRQEAQELFLHTHLESARFCDVLFLNDIEWEAVAAAQTKILQLAKYVVVTRGKEGGEIFVSGRSQVYEAKIVPVIDETGAGDAFAAGFVGATLRGLDLEQAIAFACDNAAGVVGKLGAKAGLLYV